MTPSRCRTTLASTTTTRRRPPRRLNGRPRHPRGRAIASTTPRPPRPLPRQPAATADAATAAAAVTAAVGSRNHRQPDLARGVVASSHIAGVTTGSRGTSTAASVVRPRLRARYQRQLRQRLPPGRRRPVAPGRRHPNPPPNLAAELPGRRRPSLGDRIRPPRHRIWTPRHRIRSAPTPCPELVPCRCPDCLGRERGRESTAAAVLAAARLCRRWLGRRRGWGGEKKGGDGAACSPPASPPGQGDRARLYAQYEQKSGGS
uniref:Uncharacterized protein n=1 Tax=Oryza meridionalis TaxID=40149 RepID=A0A0E0DPZ9_9ORYZ